ncbi:ATP-binding protein [Rheinheimera baltica]|uniref:ATP-binding protein n=1 Tax=Rheinheimera baltica TaxID=67576 RepID=UPI000429AE70|nr:ATP-binding protein [Rheinheimera baltica]
MNFESRKINSARLCYGLANIGYKSHAAVEDIVDNSISAGAKKIKIVIVVNENKNLTDKGSIGRITIVDNGFGMDNSTIRKALDIGSDVSYSSKSLSKYGLGLKSAGLSLGEKITVISKKNDKYTDVLILDINEVEKKDDYGVLVENASSWDTSLFMEGGSGTIVDISSINNYDTVNTLKRNLMERLGVIYYEFLKAENGLYIELVVNGKSHDVEPKDIMFSDDCSLGFDEYSYDCKTPCSLLKEEEIFLPNAPIGTPAITLNLNIFPQKSMEKYLGFSAEDRAKIKEYNVSLPNSGFFIYRNNRLIRWGDNLGIVDRDLRTLRGRIDITTEHDELLNVDVSKQNLELPDEFLDILSLKCRIPKDNAVKAFKLCTAKLELNEDLEGDSASESVIDVVEEDPNVFIELDNEEVKKRVEIIYSTNSTEDLSGDSVLPKDKFKKIVYRDYLSHSNLWEFKLDIEYGTVVQINKSHPFYQLVLKNLNAADSTRQALECFIYCLAVGEVMTKKNLSSVNFDEIKLVLERYNQVVSWNLQNWTAHNQDLFD